MKSHLTENFLPANPRFHLPRGDGLYQPIPFAFVNERMRQCIVHERQAILDALSPTVRARQQKVFEGYDPDARHRTYEHLLNRFRVSENE